MANRYTTKSADVKVYDGKGTQSALIKIAGTTLTVTGGRVSIPNRGLCWPISAPYIGYVQESDVIVTVVDGGGTPPPPPPDTSILTVVDASGAKSVSVNGVTVWTRP